jgi:uroporphyrin-3 C-methyltransferase
MSSPPPIDPPATAPSPSPPPPPPPPQQAHLAGAVLSAIALLLALAALGTVVWQWLDTRSTLEGIRQEVGKRLADSDTQMKQGRALAEQSREASTDAQVKLGILENRVAESQNHQIALEALYQELSRNRDEWAYAEIEQSLLIASQQLQLAGNVKTALIALQNADARLQRLDRPQLLALRKAINRDLEKLKALPYADTTGIAVRLDNVIAAVDMLPLATEVRPAADAGAEPSAQVSAKPWHRFMREAWGELKQLVRVQHMDRPEVPLLAPSQSFFLRENLKLRLLGARLALLTRDQTSYKADLKAAGAWLTKYYDTREKTVGNALVTLKNLHDSEISIEVPDISGTLDALRAMRAARERQVR